MLSHCGYRITRAVDEPQSAFPVLPLVVAELLRRTGDCFVVQIGANDGLTSDPIRELIVRHRLKGILVEPVPHHFERLKANYENQDGLTFCQYAIAPRDGTETLFAFRRENPFPAWAQGLAGFSRQHLLTFGLPQAEQYIIKMQVPAVTMATLLKSQNIKNVGLLQIDTEGFDADIVAQTLACDIRPLIINYEFKHLSAPTRAECKRRLLAAGYVFIDVYPDTLALRRDCLDR